MLITITSHIPLTMSIKMNRKPSMNLVMQYCFGQCSVTQTGIDPATPPSDLLAGAQAICAAQDASVQRGSTWRA